MTITIYVPIKYFQEHDSMYVLCEECLEKIVDVPIVDSITVYCSNGHATHIEFVVKEDK